MKINRRKFLKVSAIAVCAVAVGGGVVYTLSRDSDPLKDIYESMEKVLATRFGQDRTSALMKDIQQEYQTLTLEVPSIGGEESFFYEWQPMVVYFLAAYRVLKPLNQTVEQVGKIIYETYEDVANHPKWLLRLIGSFKYDKGYIERLREAATESQKRQYPENWVCTFVEGDGEEFDYGFDMTECFVCKFYHALGADELIPYICLGDYAVSKAFDRGLVRYRTLAEGAEVCDFRYKKGRETFVYPLRDGWPPKFLNVKAGHS